jgi:sodium pump decarboxylase gamma subunit
MADYGSVRKKKGCVNLSLRDSGTKSRKFLRVLLTFALAVALLVTTGVVALAEENGTASGELDKFASGFHNIDADAPITEKLMYGLEVAGIGMMVVFLVLVLIMAILYVFKLFATSGQKKAAPAPAAAPAAASAADDEQTIVAIATAAIAAERGDSECAFKVISVTKIQ